MNKTSGIIVLVIIVIVGAGYLVLNNSDVTTEVIENDPEDPTVSDMSVDVVLKTNMGDIGIDLFTEEMPITTGNFLKLANEGFYNGVKFHRVIPNFMAQAGDPLTKDDSRKSEWGTGGPGYTIEDEFVTGISNTRGTISMANTGVQNSGGSQFFINVVDNIGLDFDKDPLSSKHPVFGVVIEGIEVVDAIVSVPTEGQGMPVDSVIIEEIIINN